MILKMWVKVSENGWVKVREKLPAQVSIDPEKSPMPIAQDMPDQKPGHR